MKEKINDCLHPLVYGPVLSRRLGISLGVDVVPYKVCSVNCVYCEVGATTDLSLNRQEFIKPELIIKAIDESLSDHPKLDSITFSGMGEPTLYSGLGVVINYIKTNYPQYQLTLITNSTLLYQDQIRKEINPIDLIIPSLDAVSEDIFRQINRPCHDLTASMVINGLIALKRDFANEIWMEVFIIPGINDTQDEIYRIKQILEIIKPTRIQLNSLDRPGTEAWVKKASPQELRRVKDMLFPLNTEIVAFNEPVKNKPLSYSNERDSILRLLNSKEYTLDEMSSILHLHIHSIHKHIRDLVEENLIYSDLINEKLYYKIKTSCY